MRTCILYTTHDYGNNLFSANDNQRNIALSVMHIQVCFKSYLFMYVCMYVFIYVSFFLSFFLSFYLSFFLSFFINLLYFFIAGQGSG